MSATKTCFFVAPIGDEKSEQRKRSDQVLQYIITPVAEKFGYKVIRADMIGKSGMITSQVIQHVFDSDLVIADLAYDNPNVFYELALRHAVRKPFIQIIEENKSIPFDVAGLRTIHLNHQDLASAEKCKSELSAQIEAIESDPDNVESPVVQAIDVQMLKGSGKQTERYLGEMMQMLSDLRGQVAQMNQRMIENSSFTIGRIIPNLNLGGPGALSTMARILSEAEQEKSPEKVPGESLSFFAAPTSSKRARLMGNYDTRTARKGIVCRRLSRKSSLVWKW